MEYGYLKKQLTLWFLMGMVYFTMEGFWRGWTNISMLFVGGLCGLLIGKLNDYPKFYNRKMWIQCLFGTIIVLIIEFTSGLILNVWLNLNIWSYDGKFGNIYGQVCIPMAILWFFLIPFGIYIDDYLCYKFFNEPKPISLLNTYKNLFLLN